MDKPIAIPSRTKAILEKHGMYAKKNFGQNFLIDSGVVDKIARSAMVSENCAVFEIGPGIGALTQYLCEYGKKVTCFEIDERIPSVLSDTLQEYDNWNVILQDFLTVDFDAYVKECRSNGYDVVVAANLPYYITTPILFKLFEAQEKVDAITVMMQKEVADRFIARVNTKDYNALSVISSYRCEMSKVMNVPKNVFMPKPNVDSAVLQFRFKPQTIENENEFFELVKACFKQRRKTIYNNLGEYFGDKEKAKQLLVDAQIDEKRRAETLTLEEFMHLYEVMNR
ncbi:MAG: 16S rRNA (adenine(1518)-N(6)/adenine(1519)-N(6))-dimethyltransferase RsmA [Longicatena sp.]|nr:16S rRNA (adenine(1518)-N(6)/adenine(1519)-N(6))-dimethyltransferase RsmA [Longicatena sp.]